MRCTVIILATVHLLLQGAAVSHLHAHGILSSEAGHAERPHIHLPGHSHSSDRNADKHGHSHRHDHHAELPTPICPSPDHDQSAFYVGCDVLTAAVERFELPSADGDSMIDSDFGRLADSVLPQFVVCSETGAPERCIFAPLLVLPHALRL